MEYDGNAQNWDVIQDDEGIMIFANNGKILLFDGYNWQGIRMDNRDHPRALGKDKNGTVFVGGVDEFGKLEYNENGERIYTKVSHELDSLGFKDIWNIHFFNEKVYFFARYFIFEYDNASGEIKTIETPKEGFIQLSVFHDESVILNMKFSDDNNICYFFDGAELTPIKNSKNINPIAFIEHGEMDILIDEKGRSYLYNEENYRFTKFDFLINKYFVGIDITCATTTKNGICIGTNGAGIYFFDYFGDIIRVFDDKDGLSNLSIRQLYFDTDNNLWIAYDNGIGFLEVSSSVSIMQEKYGINFISEDILMLDSMAYIATHTDFFSASIHERPFYFTTKSQFQQDLFQCKKMSFPDGKSYILIIANNGLYAIPEGENKIQVAEDVYAWDLFQSTSNPNLVHVGLDGGGVGKITYENGTFHYAGEYENTGGDVRSLIEEDHLLYYGSRSEGVFKIDLQDNNTVTRLEGLLEYEDESTKEEHFQLCKFQDTIYVGGVNGLYKIVNDELIPAEFGNDMNQANLNIYRMRNDNDERLWLVIFRNSGIEGKEKEEIGYLEKSESGSYYYVTSQFKDISQSVIYDLEKDFNGNYWFAGDDRISIYNPLTKVEYDSVRAPLIVQVSSLTDSVYFENPRLLSPEDFVLPYTKNTLVFKFTSTSYFGLFENEFSWYLEGLETEWTKWENINEINYQRLGEGDYTFHLKSKNYYGYESPETTLSFTILPPWYRTWWAYIIYLILGVLLIYIMIRLAIHRVKQQNQRLEEIVEERTAEIASQNAVLEHQKAEIEEKTNDILDSIVYAKRIQNTILPTKDKMNTHFKSEHFVLYKPKDIVSGDFYWTGLVDGRTIFAAIDCTGHGVPGAFVSIVGFNGMNRAIKEFKKRKPGEILDQLRDIVVETFTQSESNVKDGMDIALCSLDYENMKVEFAGAHNPLIILRGNEFIEVKGNKQPIGEFEKATKFDTHTVDIQKGDCLYVFTDGYADQFGGEKGKKLKSKNLKALLLKYKDEPMSRQQELLDQAFEDWKKGFEQLDDVCLIGVRIE